MLQLVIRVLAALLLLGAALHAWGSLVAFKPKTAERAWSLGSAGFATLLALLGWLVAGRPDPLLAWLIAGGSLGWVLTVGAFGRAIGNLLDPRVLYHLLVGAALGIASILLASA